MTEFTVFNESNAPAASKTLLKTVKAKYGFVPNLMGELAISPGALEAYASLSSIFGQTSLSPIEQQVVLLTTSFESNSSYDMAVHSTISLNLGIDRDSLMAIREGRVIETDSRLQALRDFTLAVVRDRGLVEKADQDVFLRSGYTKANILEVVTGVATKILANYTNHIAETEIDPAFEAMAWSKPLLQPA